MPISKTTSIDSLPPLLTTAQASEILQCNPRTICNMCKSGKLQAIRVNSLWRINRDALLAFAGISAN